MSHLQEHFINQLSFLKSKAFLMSHQKILVGN